MGWAKLGLIFSEWQLAGLGLKNVGLCRPLVFITWAVSKLLLATCYCDH